MQHLATWGEGWSPYYGSCRDSTPHAPRLLHRPLRLNTNTNFSKLPPQKKPATPVAPLLTQGMTTSSNAARITATATDYTMPRNSRSSRASSERVMKGTVQPYRRFAYREAPRNVPRLDLSELNQPDQQLPSVQLFSITNDTPSQCSWGVWQPPRHKGSDLQLEDCEQDESAITYRSHSSVMTSSPPTFNTTFLKKSQLEFIEGQIAQVGLATEALERQGTGMKRILSAPSRFPSSYVSTPSRRLQFEARVASLNGKDIHRQLCGYFFMDDNSLTIYEFRQFGKKYNASPIIHRGIYSACSGKKRDQNYKISDIRKGATLQFITRDHPYLPNSIQNRAILSIKIISVTGQQRIYIGDKQSEDKQIAEASPLGSSASLRDAHLLATMQGMLCHLLTGRASRVLVGLGRHLQAMATNNVVTFNQLEQALRAFQISLTIEDMSTFWRLVRDSDVWNESPPGLCQDMVLQTLTGIFTEDLISLTRQAFMKLDTHKLGTTSLTEIRKACKNTEGTIWQNMESVLQSNSSDSVSYADFENVCIGVRLDVSSRSKFIKEMSCTWGL